MAIEAVEELMSAGNSIGTHLVSICTPYDPEVVGFKLFKLVVLLLLSNALLTVLAVKLWQEFSDWLERRAARGSK